MNFREFESELHDKSKEFLEFYANNMRHNPEIFPLEMNISEWWEQMQMYIDSAYD